MGWGKNTNSPPPRGEGSGAGGSVRNTADLPATRRIGGPLHPKLARHLRNETTHWERRLWTWLRTLRKTHGLQFRRQVPLGRFVADFVCHSVRLIIELDGPFHEPERDRERDAWFAKAGYQTLRFPNHSVIEQWDRVVAEIEYVLGIGDRLEGPLSRLQPPTPNPSPQGGGESLRRRLSATPDTPTGSPLRAPPHEGEG